MGRLYWVLSCLGAYDTKILDGHIDAWKAARKSVTKNPRIVKAVTYAPKPDKSKIATIAEIKSAIENVRTVIVNGP